MYPAFRKQQLIIQKSGTTKDHKDKNALSITCAFILCQKHPYGHGTTIFARSRLSFSTELIMSPFEGTELAKQFECPTYKLQW
jgi:hypothetical protein